MALERPQKSTALKRILEAGAALTGSTGGAAVGLVVAGPPGAIGGAAVGWAAEELAKAGGDIAQRMLSHRAEARVGAVFLLADGEISARLMAGDLPREDLRDEITPGRSAASELLEAALITAAQTHEERKLPYMAHLLAAIAFESKLSHADANQLIALADALTYRQLVVLAVFSAVRADNSADYDYFFGEVPEFVDEDEGRLSIRVDMLDLFQRGLLKVRKRQRPAFDSLGGEPAPWPAIPGEMSPRDTLASESGARLARMMRLHEVSQTDRDTLIVQHLRIPDQ